MIGTVNQPIPLHARILQGVHEVEPSAWNRLLTAEDPPVLDWHWLAALESSGSAAPHRDWIPAHLGLFVGPELVAVCPLYLREGTEGEFVWSGPILAAFEELGRPAWPRGVSTIPGTPVPSRRFLTGPKIDRVEGIRLLAQGLVEIMGAEGLASLALHFCADDEVQTLQALGWVVRHQWQYQWRREGLTSFDGYLQGFRARRRASIRRERREVAARGVSVEFLDGEEAPDALFEEAGRLYCDTAARHGGEQPLLDPCFFGRVAASPLRDRLLLGVARDADGVCALTFNIRGADALYGRAWGAARPVPFLHFELAYYAAISWCIEHGVDRFEPGHGGEYKQSRGFPPRTVKSLHLFADQRLHGAVRAWATRERASVDRWIAEHGGPAPDGG